MVGPATVGAGGKAASPINSQGHTAVTTEDEARCARQHRHGEPGNLIDVVRELPLACGSCVVVATPDTPSTLAPTASNPDGIDMMRPVPTVVIRTRRHVYLVLV